MAKMREEERLHLEEVTVELSKMFPNGCVLMFKDARHNLNFMKVNKYKDPLFELYDRIMRSVAVEMLKEMENGKNKKQAFEVNKETLAGKDGGERKGSEEEKGEGV